MPFDLTVSRIYRAAAGQERFTDAIEAMVKDLGPDHVIGAQMVGLDPATGGLTFSHTNAGAPGEAELEYMRSYHRVDPRLPHLLKREPCDWLWCEDLFDDAAAAEQPYYRDLLIPYGGRHSASAKLLESEREIVMIAVLSRLGQGGFKGWQREYLGRVGHHWREALTIHRHVRSLAAGHAVGLELIERLGKAAWVVDDMRELSGGNHRAIRAMEEGVPFREIGGRLAGPSPQAENLLAAAITGLARRAERGEPAGRTVVKLPTAGNGPAAVVSVTLFEPGATLHAFGQKRQFLLLLHTPAAVAEPDVYLWQVAFDLTPAEGRVTAEVFRGRSLRAAAQSLGISHNTANTQLDAVYAKTRTHNKVELVKLLQAVT